MISSAPPLSSNLNDWTDMYEYISTYGAHIALWAILSAMTVYRREISCNRSYHEDDDEDIKEDRKKLNSRFRTRKSVDDMTESIAGEEKELMTEELLDGAGLYCSGQPILNLAQLLWLGFESCEKDKQESTSDNLTPEDILDRVGNYASPEPIFAALAYVMKREWIGLDSLSCTTSPLNIFSVSSFLQKNHDSDPLGRGLPPDIHVHIASFLHPRDVVTLSCVSKAYRSITHDTNNVTSATIWKTLWERDYGWIVFKWKIGKEALERSNCREWVYSKNFYFLFAQSYLDYVLAGHNTFQSCLVGIHSNIYDITPFLFSHPGSPDTLMVHSGRDATGFFDDMGHSIGARKLAMSMCVVVDRSAQSQNDKCGLFPTTHTRINDDENDDDHHRIPQRLEDGEDKLVEARRKRGRKIKMGDTTITNGGGTLYHLRTCFLEEREKVRNRNMKKYSKDSTVLGHEVNIYFDPFTRHWRIWYTDTDLRTIYLPAS